MQVMFLSSPAITALPGGGYEIAFANAADQKLWEIGPDGHPVQAASGPAVDQATSPAIAASPDGSIEIAYHATGTDEKLWYVDPAGNASDTGQSMLISPAIVALPGGGFEIAYEDFEALVSTLIPGDAPQHTSIAPQAEEHPGIAVPIAAPKKVLVPDFLGDNLQDVENTIAGIHLTVGRITQDNRCIDFQGTVLDQDPAGGAEVDEGTPINLLVSSGVDANGKPCILK
jgi:hypothetical protein